MDEIVEFINSKMKLKRKKLKLNKSNDSTNNVQ